jgi:hypothetical protein
VLELNNGGARLLHSLRTFTKGVAFRYCLLSTIYQYSNTPMLQHSRPPILRSPGFEDEDDDEDENDSTCK